MRVTLADPARSHQIYLFLVGSQIAVSCNCLRGIDGTSQHHSPIEVRTRWGAPEAFQVYRAWHAARVGEAAP